jgi:hypothetical protein
VTIKGRKPAYLIAFLNISTTEKGTIGILKLKKQKKRADTSA